TEAISTKASAASKLASEPESHVLNHSDACGTRPEARQKSLEARCGKEDCRNSVCVPGSSCRLDGAGRHDLVSDRLAGFRAQKTGRRALGQAARTKGAVGFIQAFGQDFRQSQRARLKGRRLD